MTDFASAMPILLFRTTLSLAIAAGMTAWLLRWIRPVSPRVHRWAWLLVILQGLIWTGIPVELPWLPDERDVAVQPHRSAVVAAIADGAEPTFVRQTGLADSGVRQGSGSGGTIPIPVAELPGRAGKPEAAGAASAPVPAEYFEPPRGTDVGALPLPSEARASPARVRAGSPSLPGWPTVCLAIWAVGGIIIAGCAGCGYLLLLTGLRRCWAAPDAWQDEWNSLLARRRVTARIPLRVHPRMGPLLCLTPRGYRVIVPQHLWGKLTASQRQVVLAHELAHYVRGDVWKSALVRLAAWPHWFNPCVWWATFKFDEAGEWSCDERSVQLDPRQAPVLARALLAMVEPSASNPLGVSAARGALLAARVRRLLRQGMEDSPMKRLVFLMGCLALIGLGLIQFRLVPRATAVATEALAQAEDPAAAAADSATSQRRLSLNERIEQLADQILAGDDETLQRFQEALRSSAGKVVMQDRAAQAEANLRAEAESEAMPTYLAEHFERNPDGKYQVRQDQAAFRQELLAMYQSFQEDLEQITPVLAEIANGLDPKEDVNRLLARFLKNEAAPVILYAAELRPRLRPGVTWVAERLTEVFARDGQGAFVIPESQRERAEELRKYARKRILGSTRLQHELKSWSAEIATPDDLHRQFQQALLDPLFVAIAIADTVGDDDTPLGDALEGYYNHLEEITQDAPDGLVLIAERRPEIEETLANYDRLMPSIERLRAPLEEFIRLIPATDELHSEWRDILQSPPTLVSLGRELNLPDPDTVKAIRAILDESLETNDQGRVQVKTDYQEQVTNQIQEYFRQFREVRRKGQALDEFARELNDPQLAALYRSLTGKFATQESIAQSLQRRQFDGFAGWRAAHFEPSGDGYILKDGAEEEIQSILSQIDDLNKEAENNDF